MRVSAILISDLHLREKTPLSRFDNYLDAQKNKLRFLKELAEYHEAPIICAGDIFDTWKVTPFFLGWCIDNMPYMYVVAGNHDLPAHSIENYEKSALSVLEKAVAVELIRPDEYIAINSDNAFHIVGSHWGCELSYKKSGKYSCRTLGVFHEMIFSGNDNMQRLGVAGYTAKEFIQKHPDIDLLLVGHNHEVINKKYKDQRLINAGSVMRMTAKQMEHNPVCFLWDANTNEVEERKIPCMPVADVLSRDHIDRVKDKEERLDIFMESFVEKVGGNINVGLDYRKNVEKYLGKSGIDPAIEKVIWEALED